MNVRDEMISRCHLLTNTNYHSFSHHQQNGYTIDTDKRRQALEAKKKANAAAGEAAKAKAKALAEKNKAAQAKALAQKKMLAEQAKAKAAAAKQASMKLNKTVGGSSKFKNSFTPAPSVKDPFAEKKWGGFSFNPFGKKD